MGSEDAEAYPADREGPIRSASVRSFQVCETAVTNSQFAEFVAATGWQTDAERFGWSFVFHQLVAVGSTMDIINGQVHGTPWWVAVRGADWAHPYGATSAWSELREHPVVHISHRDALAFCRWSGTRLPSEVEWEYAARGGLEQARYPWGNELTPNGIHQCNIWQGAFPEKNTGADGYVATAPARSFSANAFGLFNTVGNVWELCATRWFPERVTSNEFVMRGGSYLCHRSYCNRYRVSARSHVSDDTTSGHIGFRVAR